MSKRKLNQAEQEIESNYRLRKLDRIAKMDNKVKKRIKRVVSKINFD